MSKHEVIIDGVKYIPAKEAVANRVQIIQGLLSDFWGVVKAEEVDEKSEDMYVIVTDSPPYECRTIEEVVNDIAKEI